MSDAAKANAARAAVAEIEDGMRLGLGTGSTAEIMLRGLAERVKGGLSVVGVPTSERTAVLARDLGIPLSTLEATPELDLAIDGTDEVDVACNLIKGGGGALLREKIIAACAARFLVIADASKRVRFLGEFPLPVEIIPMAAAPLSRRIAALGAKVGLRTIADEVPFVTDEGHHILDCAFGEITDPATLAVQLHAMPGVVEHGLFVGMADAVLIGTDNNVERLP